MDQIFVHLITLSGPQEDLTMINLLLKASPVVKLVLLVLLVMSVTCWWIIASKYTQLKKAQQQTHEFLDLFWGSQKIQDVYDQCDRFLMSPVAQCFRKAYVELARIKEVKEKKQTDLKTDVDNIYRALKREQGVQIRYMSEKTSFLATVSSAAPFVGLFGTVWGIMDAFLNIAQQGNATLTTVAPPIAEALIATAIGLVAAIPAVIGYNAFYNQIKHLDIEIDTFSNDFLNIIKRHLS